MMTVHSAKGLEFPVVFLPGMEDGLFPGMKTVMEGDAEMEEERRLAYVAITRAKRELIILHTKTRLLYSQTMYNPISRFVKEIPEELIEKLDPDESASYQASPFGRSAYGAGYGHGYGPKETPIPQPRTYFSAADTGKAPSRGSFGRPAPSGERTGLGNPFSVGIKKPTAEKKPLLQAGDRVKHANFGEGEIISVKPMGADTLYEIMFDKVGTKKLMATYAKLTKIRILTGLGTRF